MNRFFFLLLFFLPMVSHAQQPSVELEELGVFEDFDDEVENPYLNNIFKMALQTLVADFTNGFEHLKGEPFTHPVIGADPDKSYCLIGLIEGLEAYISNSKGYYARLFETEEVHLASANLDQLVERIEGIPLKCGILKRVSEDTIPHVGKEVIWVPIYPEPGYENMVIRAAQTVTEEMDDMWDTYDLHVISIEIYKNN